MSNFQLIDDYLANRLNEQDKAAFEQQLQGDPSLKSEVDFQRQIIESVKSARAAELKTMLNNVPVGGSVWTGTKLAAAVVSAGLVSSLLYFTLKGDENTITTEPQAIQEEVAVLPDATKEEAPVEPVVTNESANTIPETREEKSKSTKENKPKLTPSPVRKPALDVEDLTKDITDSSDDNNQVEPASGTNEITLSKTEVTTVSDKKHTFHYQFKEGKLLLFGPFDKNLYEILEIHGVSHAVFLFYRENYYLMNEDQTEITSLQLIKDTQLLKKLKEYRGR